MDINAINSNSRIAAPTAPKSAPAEDASKKNSTLASDNKDSYEKAEVGYSPAYTKASIKKNNADDSANSDVKNTETSKIRNKSAMQIKNESMQALVQKTIGKQASASSSDPMNALQNLINGKTETSTDEDYWGAEATANRILDFAKNLAGDNTKLISTLKDAFKKGFSAAEGGKKSSLPSVCYDTYDKVMKGFDDWEKSAKGTSETDTETDTEKTSKTEE